MATFKQFLEKIPGRSNSQNTVEEQGVKVIINIRYVSGYYTVALHIFQKGNFIGDYTFETGLKKKKVSTIERLRVMLEILLPRIFRKYDIEIIEKNF